MSGADIKIGTAPNGDKAVVAVDMQSGVRVIIPLTPEGATALASGLAGGLVVAHQING